MQAKLLYSITEIEPDGYYFGKFKSMDAITMMGTYDEPICLIHKMELERAKKEGRFEKVFELIEYKAKGKEKFGVSSLASAIATVADEMGYSSFEVPQAFSASIYQELLNLGVKVEIAKGELFAQRQIKNTEEIDQLREAAKVSEAGFARVREMLSASEVASDGVLHLDGKILTCEELRKEIRVATTQAGGGYNNPIAASGLQAADCHCLGYGPVKAGEMIVVDIFPRHDDNYMCGDISRTYVKGQASEKQQHIYDTVWEAFQASLKLFGPGAKLGDIDQAARDVLVKNGYETKLREDGLWQGCYCGIGHGLGLEVHEPPYIGRSDMELQVGHVMTLEPGLYIPEYGGCRVEDTLVITEDGYEFINTPEYHFVID